MSNIPLFPYAYTCLQWKLCVESHSLAYLFLFSIYKSRQTCSDYLVFGKTHQAILVKINSHFVFAKTEPLICIVH